MWEELSAVHTATTWWENNDNGAGIETIDNGDSIDTTDNGIAIGTIDNGDSIDTTD